MPSGSFISRNFVKWLCENIKNSEYHFRFLLRLASSGWQAVCGPPAELHWSFSKGKALWWFFSSQFCLLGSFCFCWGLKLSKTFGESGVHRPISHAASQFWCVLRPLEETMWIWETLIGIPPKKEFEGHHLRSLETAQDREKLKL